MRELFEQSTSTVQDHAFNEQEGDLAIDPRLLANEGAGRAAQVSEEVFGPDMGVHFEQSTSTGLHHVFNGQEDNLAIDPQLLANGGADFVAQVSEDAFGPDLRQDQEVIQAGASTVSK